MASSKGKAQKIDGMPVVDAIKPVVLHIGQHDIPKSKAQNPAGCVAARACVRDLHAEEARVHLSRVFLRMPGQKKWMRFQTPGSLRSEIIAFDRGGRFIVGEYTLLPISPSDKREYHKDAKARSHQGKGGKAKKRVNHRVKDVRVNGHAEMDY